MAATVRLKRIVEELQMHFDESSSYFDLETGEVETVDNYLLSRVEDGDEGEAPDTDWEKEEWELANRIVHTDRYLALPSEHDIHEWSIMQDFARSVRSGSIRQDLERAIGGAGAFRNFKDAVRRHHIEDAWYRFRDEALKQVAIEWCEENGLTWE